MDALQAMIDRIQAERTALGRSAEPFEVAVFGFSDPTMQGVAQAYADVGAGWWLESLSPMRGSIDELLAIVQAGPPASA